MTGWTIKAISAVLGATALCLVTAGAGAAAQPGPGRPTALAVTAASPLPAEPGQRCFRATGTHHGLTLFGNTFFRFTHTAHWCSDGRNVIGVHQRDRQFTDVSAFAYVEPDPVEDSLSPIPAPEVASVMKFRIDNCVTQYGCVWAFYPYVRLTMRADGTWFATTGDRESSTV